MRSRATRRGCSASCSTSSKPSTRMTSPATATDTDSSTAPRTRQKRCAGPATATATATVGTGQVPDAEWVPDADFWRHRPVAVTGATGFLGGHLTARLTDLGAEVVVLVRDTVPLNPITARWMDRVSVVRGSVEDQTLDERLL